MTFQNSLLLLLICAIHFRTGFLCRVNPIDNQRSLDTINLPFPSYFSLCLLLHSHPPHRFPSWKRTKRTGWSEKSKENRNKISCTHSTQTHHSKKTSPQNDTSPVGGSSILHPTPVSDSISLFNQRVSFPQKAH